MACFEVHITGKDNQVSLQLLQFKAPLSVIKIAIYKYLKSLLVFDILIFIFFRSIAASAPIWQFSGLCNCEVGNL